MKLLLKVCVCVMLMANIVAMAAPVANEAEATITSYDYKLTENGYYFEYSTSNGITRRENGEYVKSAKSVDDDTILHVTGSYSYLDDKGELHTVNYGADENGFLVQKPLVLPPSVVVPASGVAFAAAAPQDARGISSAALASLSG